MSGGPSNPATARQLPSGSGPDPDGMRVLLAEIGLRPATAPVPSPSAVTPVATGATVFDLDVYRSTRCRRLSAVFGMAAADTVEAC